MATLRPLDLRTSAEREGITKAQQTAQAISNILKTIGAAEQKRQERQTLDRVATAIAGGATTIEAISAAAGRGAEFDTGVPGALQKLGGLFQPSQGGTQQSIQQTIIGQVLKSVLSPPTSEYSKLPGWWEGATEKQRQDYRNRVGGPLVQVGQKLLTSEQRQALADKGFKEEMGLSEAQRNTARRSVKTIVQEMGHGTWAGDLKGFKNYKRDNLIAGYEQYRTENNYASKSPEHRKWLDKNWDDQMMTYNKAGYKLHGKNEFDWNPKDSRVQELRKEAGIPRKYGPVRRIRGEKEPVYGLLEPPQDNDGSQPPPSILKAWDAIPDSVKAKIDTALRVGRTWEQILGTSDLEKYLK